ncbi:hypothetical protein F4813DRAFT_352953 [Daldinia decipiens]|uniref:uncharacterized protein n=1 Tax=Daldinia decipiens TaxID=326647 RepID=UPI0020C2C896|nr:uncharacterized protein F4813DRAFT_352953 [Daldinia decipiens]KAI1659427.1 hypothetical protein F4813DRAFT_352953 [Daldinia decipiens]
MALDLHSINTMTPLDEYESSCEALFLGESLGGWRAACHSHTNSRSTACLIGSVDILSQSIELQPRDTRSLKYQHLDATLRENKNNTIQHAPIWLEEHGDVLIPPVARVSSPSPVPSLDFSLTDSESSTIDDDLDDIEEKDDTFQWCRLAYNHDVVPRCSSTTALDQWSKFESRIGFREVGNNGLQDTEGNDQGMSITHNPENRSAQTHTKRRRELSDINENSDEGSLSASKRALSSRKDSRLRYACPFSKFDATRYLSCSQYELHRVGDVRQHIVRKHSGPIHCPRCGMIFDRDLKRDEHIRHDACEIKDFLDIEGLTTDQLTRVRDAAMINSWSSEEKWYQIWDTLFPGASRPASPYYDGGMLVPLGVIESHMTTTLPAIIGQSLISKMSIPRSTLDTCLHEAVKESFAQFKDAFQPAPNSPAAGETKLALNGPVATEASLPYITSNPWPNDTFSNTLAERSPLTEAPQIEISPQTTPNYDPNSTRESHSHVLDTTQPTPIEFPNHRRQHSDPQTSVYTSTQGRRPLSNERWEAYKDKIHQLYINENKTLQELMVIMKENHGFDASAKMYKTQFKRWEFTKYNKSHLRESPQPAKEA